MHHGTVNTLGSRRRSWDERAQLFDNVVISHGYFICSLCASACARVKLLRRFWDRGRVCGDRSVFVTSPSCALISRALVQAGSNFAFRIEVIFLLPTCHPAAPPCLWIWRLAKILDELAVPDAFRTKLLDSACLKVWQFAEYVDDVKDWTSILSCLEPPIVDHISCRSDGTTVFSMHIASVRRA